MSIYLQEGHIYGCIKKGFQSPLIRAVSVFLLANTLFLMQSAHAAYQIQRDDYIGLGLHNGARTENFYKGIKEPQYHLYFGYFHAHTYCSGARFEFFSASGTPCDAFEYAKNQGLDFLGLADHDWGLTIPVIGEFIDEILEIINPFKKFFCWDEAFSCARDWTRNDFVALNGFEWSNSSKGHVTVMNTSDSLSSIACNYCCGIGKTFLDWLNEHSNAIAIWNHPEDGHHNRFKLAEHGYLPQIVAMELFTGCNRIDRFYNFFDYNEYDNIGTNDGYDQDGYGLPFLDEALQLGWLIGVVGSQDTHDENWGKENGLVGVWAETLTREKILNAYASQRTYASEWHRHLSINFTIDGYPMGAKMTPRNAMAKVRIKVNCTYDSLKERGYGPIGSNRVLGIRVIRGYVLPDHSWNEPEIECGWSYGGFYDYNTDTFFVDDEENFLANGSELLPNKTDYETRVYWYVVAYVVHTWGGQMQRDIIAVTSPIWMYWKDPYDPSEPDIDQDSIKDAWDNCPWDFNPGQVDSDSDSVGDECDNCKDEPDPEQANNDHDEYGNYCDNCPDVQNNDQADEDEDGVGDVCDNCPDVYNPDQINSDIYPEGDRCQDLDDDNIIDMYDCDPFNPYLIWDLDKDEICEEISSDNVDLCLGKCERWPYTQSSEKKDRCRWLCQNGDNCPCLWNNQCPSEHPDKDKVIRAYLDYCLPYRDCIWDRWRGEDCDAMIEADLCHLFFANPGQNDLDNDGWGDHCESEPRADIWAIEKSHSNINGSHIEQSCGSHEVYIILEGGWPTVNLDGDPIIEWNEIPQRVSVSFCGCNEDQIIDGYPQSRRK